MIIKFAHTWGPIIEKEYFLLLILLTGMLIIIVGERVAEEKKDAVGRLAVMIINA